MDMVKDWKEVCDALGTPVMVDAHDHSFTKRRRAYWTNIVLPANWKEGHGPKDPNTVLNPGHRVQKYYASGRMCTRPLGASWKGDENTPHAATNRPLVIID